MNEPADGTNSYQHCNLDFLEMEFISYSARLEIIFGDAPKMKATSKI